MVALGRRDLLRGAGALLATPAVARLGTRDQATGPFSWGVASFDPTATSVLLWTRVTSPAGGGARQLRWTCAADEGMGDEVLTGEVTVDAASDHCAVVEAGPLAPGRVWWYRFEADDGASAVGRTRTMADGAVERLRLGVVSCSRYASGGFAAYRALAGREVDLVLHLGDYIYEDGEAGARPHDPPSRLRTLDEYRRRYAQHRSDPALQALHARHPMVAVWDDHDLATNAWRDGAAGHDEARDGPWTNRLAAATQAREEWVPGRTVRGGDGRLQAWRSLALGDLAEVVVLDARTHRDPPPATADDVRRADRGEDRRSMLGPDQAAFVTGRLQDAGRPPWVVLANQVMFHPLRLPIPSDALVPQLEEAGFLAVDGTAVNPDQWDGYPAARQEITAAAGGAGGVVVLTGDVHSSWAWAGPADDGSRDGGPAVVELVTPSVSTEALDVRLPVPGQVLESALLGVDPELSYVEVRSQGYLLVDLNGDEVRGEWWYVDPQDDAAAERFGAARRAPRQAPMRLEEVTEPATDPSSTPSAAPPVARDDGGGDGSPLLPIGAGAAGLAALAGALAVAARRRRTPGASQ